MTRPRYLTKSRFKLAVECPIRSESIFNSGIQITEAAEEIVKRQGHMAGCQLDHSIEIQDVVDSIMKMPEQKAIARAWESLQYKFMTKKEHEEKTQLSRTTRKAANALTKSKE